MELKQIEDSVWDHGAVTRNHLVAYLTTQHPADPALSVGEWLKKLHDDPKYSKVVFPQGDITRILDDLESYVMRTSAHPTVAPGEPTGLDWFND